MILTSGEKKAIRRSKELTVTMTAVGEAESTEEITAHGNDLDVFVTVMQLDDSPAALSLGLLCEEMATPLNGKRESRHR